MTTFIEKCPWCDQPIAEPVDTAVETADSFCRHCDQPLFWVTMLSEVPAGQPLDAPGSTSFDWMDDPTRRRPGLAGVESSAAVECWQCGEPNQQVATTCHRCGADIPPPATEVEEESTVGPCTAPTGDRARRRIDVPAWLLVALGITLVVVAVILATSF